MEGQEKLGQGKEREGGGEWKERRDSKSFISGSELAML